MKYEMPIIEFVEAELVLLQSSELGPGATDIGAPSFDAKESVWDEEDNTNNINNKEENYGEDWN